MRKPSGAAGALATGIGLALALVCLGSVPSAALGSGSCPNEQTRAEARSLQLPDCRAYELVTPPYKEGEPVITSNIAPDGAHVIGQSFGAFAGTPDVPKGIGLLGASYEFSRTGAGWVTAPLTPSAALFAEDFSGNSIAGQLVSSDFGTTDFVLNRPSQSPAQRDLYLRKPDGTFALLSPMTPPGATVKDDLEIVGGSSDLSQILFTLESNRWPGDTTETGSLSLYAAVAGVQEPKLVGVMNSGPLVSNAEAQLISNCGTELGRAEGGEFHGLSADGRVVYFKAKPCAPSPLVGELYARFDGSRTVAISEPSPPLCSSAKCLAAEAGERQEAFFQGASEDGSKVFFTTAQPLLDGDGDTTSDLYEAEVTSSGVQRMIQVSQGDSSDPTPGTGANVLSVAAVANDGSRAYFVAEGVLTAAANQGGQKAAAGAPNLYLAEPGTGRIAFITTLEGPEAEAVLTPDGRFLVFRGPPGPLYEYDAVSGSLTTIAPSGFGARVSSDGAYVFFDSTDALTPAAASGVSSVYEYHGGAISLIADGRSAGREGARLLGADAAGANVFFETLDPLVLQDTDEQLDVYDARIGGGFPAVAAPAECSGDGCQQPGAPAPTGPTAASVTQLGGGNILPPSSVMKPKTGPPTRAASLSRALAACRTRHHGHLRAACEAHARRKLGRHSRAHHAAVPGVPSQNRRGK